jgi:hypothetical protein
MTNNIDWSSLFAPQEAAQPEEDQAIPDSSVEPQDWSLLFQDPSTRVKQVETPHQPIPEQPVSKPARYIQAFEEQLKQMGRSVFRFGEVLVSKTPVILSPGHQKAMDVMHEKMGPEQTALMEKKFEPFNKELGDRFKRAGDVKLLAADKVFLESMSYDEKIAMLIPQVLTQVGLKVFGGPAGWALSSGFMGSQIIGSSYEQSLEEGATPERAAKYAIINAAWQLPMEQFGLGKMTKLWPTKTALMLKIKHFLMASGTEGLTEAMQVIPDKITSAMALDTDLETLQAAWDAISDLDTWKQMLEEGSLGAIMGGGIHATGTLAQAAGIIQDIRKEAGATETSDNALNDANEGDVDTDGAPDKIETKKDAKSLLEEVGRRMVEGETQEPSQEDPGQDPIIIDAAAQDIQIEEEETGKDFSPLFDPTKVDEDIDKPLESLRYRVETEPDDDGAEFYGFKEGERAISITDKESPAYQATFVVKKGSEDIGIARKEREFLAGKKDVEGYVENWMANPESRSDWADKRPQAKGEATPQVKTWDSGVRLEAVHAYQAERGKKDVVLESAAVKELRRSLDDGDVKEFSGMYGDDFVSQVDESELDTVSLGAKKLIEAFHKVPVFPVKWSQKVMDDVDSPLHRHHGARTFDSGAITFVVGDDPIRMLNTIFHEKSHDLKKTNPELHKEAAEWIYANASHPKIKEALEDLKRTYGDDVVKLEDELVAKVKGELAAMEEYQVKLLEKLKKEDPSLYNKIVDFMLDMLKDIKAFITQNGDGSEGYKNILNDIDAAIEFFTDLDIKEFRAGTAGRMENIKIKAGKKGGKLGGLMQNIVDNEGKSKTFFSAMNKFLFGGKQPKIQGKKLQASNVKAQLVAWAKAGEFKMAELNWSPVLEWLDTQKVVSAQDVRTYIKDNNVIVTSRIFKESGMTSEDIKEDLGHLEQEISMVESNIDSMFYDYTFVGSGIEVPESILFTTSPEEKQKGRRFRITNNGEIDDIEAYLIHKDITDDVHDIVGSLRSIMTLSNGLKDSVGVSAGRAQYGPEEYPNLTTAGSIEDYAEVILKLDLPQARINAKKYQRVEKVYKKISQETLKMHDDSKRHKDDWSEEMQVGIARAIVAKTRIKQRLATKMREYGAKMDSFYYESGHFKGPILGHIRLTSRYIGDKLVLFIEEVQSDWQQLGRKKGFRGEEVYPAKPQSGAQAVFTPVGFHWETATKKLSPKYNAVLHQLVRDKNGEVVGESTTRLEALTKAGIKQSEMVPDTPFKPFSELALKKIARIAVESGHDYVAWTPAAEHIRRYNLAKYVDRLDYSDRYDKPVLKGYMEGAQVGTWTIEEGRKLEDYVGKTIANKLNLQFEEDSERMTAILDVDEDTQVGDFQWAVNLYDKMIPRMANKLFGKKSWGNARTRELELDVSEGEEGKIIIETKSGNIMTGYSSLHELLSNYEGESWDLVIKETKETKEKAETEEPDYANKIGFIERQIKELEELKAVDATFSIVHDQPMPVLGFPVTDKMEALTKGRQTLFDLDAPRAVKTGMEIAVDEVKVAKGYFETTLDDGISGDDQNRHYREKRLGFTEPSADWMESGRIIRDIWGSFKETEGSNSVALKALSAVALGSDVRVDENDYGVIPIIESMGFQKVDKTTYRFDERIPQDADIIAGMYQAAWHVDLKSKRSTKKLYSQIAKQFGVDKGFGKGEGKLAKHKEKLKKYLEKSWRTYRAAADGTSKGDFLPSKNVLLRPAGIGTGKGRQLLVQISSDFKSEGSSNIGDSYYEALYNKREGYLRPSRDFWELPEWMTRMAYFMPDADVYVIRNIKEAKQFFNQAGYDTIFFSVLDITKAPVKSIAESYSGDILAGGYLPDGSYYKGMKNVTWVEDMEAAAKELGVEYKNGVDYRHFKNTKTIPRLEMSKGCLHKCAFCSQDRFLTISSPEAITQQIKEYKAFDYEIVYLNDKTFGQAENYPDLVNIKKEIQAVNPNFKGFVIQTTATQYNKMPDEFLQNSGIVYVELGVETFNDKQLASLDKPHREKHILEAAEKIRRLNQVFVPNVMVGLAGKNKDGSTWVESVRTYGRTLKFLNDNTDIISHMNIGVLAAETGTKLHEQLDAVEADSDEFASTRSWLKNQKIHDKFFEQLSAMGERQLDSAEVKDYVKKSIKINTEVKDAEFAKKAASLMKLWPDKDMLKPNKVTGEVMFDLVGYKEGSKQSETYHKAYFDIFNIAKKANGMKKVRAYLESKKYIYGLPVTEELIKNIGNHADKLAKNKKKMLDLKKIVTLREGIAAGLLDPRDPKVIKRMEKHSNFMPYTIRHTGDSFFIGENMKYGKFTDKVVLFDEGSDVTRVSKKPYVDPVTGAHEVMEKFYDKEGVRLIKAPIFSTNKVKRINEIKAIVKKNIRYADWYKRWKDFVFQFAEEGKSDIEIKRIAAISGLLGAGKSPQIQQGIWADTVNKLTAGRTPRKAAKNELVKIMDIWNGNYDEILGKTDDEGILEIQKVFGRKIGPYLAAAVDPSSPNVLVLDRHMPKGWGYNVLHSVGNQQGGFNMHPSIEHEIASDIFQVAEEMEMDVAGVQAALWFDFRTPASDVSDIVNIAQIEPGKYVPYVWHKRTFPAITTGIHYKKTDLKLGDYVLGATLKGEAKFNSYSRTDIGRRLHEVTDKWPYQPAVYMYTPEAKPEPQVTTGAKGYTFKYDPSEIYDGVKDPYLYWDEAIKQLKKDPGANLTNIFLKLVSDREQYNGVLVRSPYDPEGQKWMLIFEKAAVQDYPELAQVGISDVIEKIETTPQDIDEAVLFMDSRSKFLSEFMKEIAAEKRYHELTFSEYFPTLARFEEATSGMLEPGLSVKIDGPLRSQRAFLSEIAIARGQREVYLMHEPRAESSYPDFIDYEEGKLFSFKVKREWDNNPAGLIKALAKSGLKEFNIVESTVTRSIMLEQFMSNIDDVAKTVDMIEKFAEPGYPRNKVVDIHSEILSGDDYRDSIIEYWGQTKGEEIYNNAIEKGREFSEEVRSGAHKKRVAKEIRKTKTDKKRIDKPSDTSGIDEDIEPETKDLLDRVGRKNVSVVDKVKERANYKKGTFITSTADKLNPLRMAVGGDTPAYMLHRGLPGIQSSINALLEHGRLTLDDSGVLTTDTKDKGFLPWIKSLGKDPDKFWYWVIVRRDSSRQERDKKYTPMFTEEERARLLSWTGTENEAGKSWQAFNKEFQEYNQSVLDIGIKSGLLDPAMVRQFKDQFYIPFYRIFEDEQTMAEFIKAPVNTKRIIAAQIKKLHGSKRQMGDPLENILANWSHLLKQSMTNASRKMAFKELTESGAVSETGEPIIEEVPWKDTVIFKSGSDGKTTFVYEKQGIEVLGFKDNGKTRFFKVNDPELFLALSLAPNIHMPRWLGAILGAPKALLTFGATITPSFVVANTTRDTMHTFTISDNFIPFWDTMRGFVKTLVKDKDYVEYMASGNSFVGSYIKADRPEAFAKFAKKIVKREGRGALGRILNSPAKLYHFWETFTEASENAARLALYSNLKKAGKTKLEASFAARDIMDFQKRGASPVVQYLTQTVPFLNARIQGLVKMGQAAAKNPGMYTLKGGMIAVASLALWAAFKDDDRYKELEDWERFAYYHFWIGEHHFRIPKPFETGVIWSSAWTAAADVMTGNDEASHITSFIGASILDTFAFNPVPQAARPIMEQYFNKTFFTGRPIVPQGFKYKEPGDRYYPWDHESAIILGKALGVSPRRIQAIVRGYLAGLGTGIMAGTDIMVRQFAEFPERPTTDIGTYPMIGRFVKKGPAKYTKYQSKFYDTFEALNQLSQKVQIAQQAGEWKSAADITKLNRKKLDAFGRAKNVKRLLGQNRKNVQQIWLDPHMTGDVKKLRLDALAVERTKALKQFWDWYLENV